MLSACSGANLCMEWAVWVYMYWPLSFVKSVSVGTLYSYTTVCSLNVIEYTCTVAVFMRELIHNL